MELTAEEVNIVRQWFDSIHDLRPDYLTASDYKLSVKVYNYLWARVQESIVDSASNDVLA